MLRSIVTESIILTAHSAQQLAVLDPDPATGDGVYRMVPQKPMDRCSSGSKRISREGFSREVE
jgi:hypothetical protein